MNTLFSSLLYTALLCLPLLASAATVPDSGLKAEMEGRWQDAIKIYEKALKKQPTQAHLWMRIADIQAHLKDNAAAMKSLQTAARHAPRNAELHYRLSLIYAGNDDKRAALQASNRAVELSPDNLDYLKARASHANWNGDYSLAQQSYRHILSIKANDDEATLGLARSSMWLGDHDSAPPAYRSYLERYPDHREALLELMEVEAERGDYPAAMKLGEEYRRRHGESLEYWLRAADLYALSGNDRASADALKQAARYAPDDAALQFRIARSHTEKEDVPHAMAALERALQLEPENIEYLRARADLSSWVGDYDTALDSYHRILAIKADDSGSMLGIARLHSWQGNSDQAIKGYQAYLEKHPKVQIAWVEYLRLEMEIGNYSTVLKRLETYRGHFGETKEYTNIKARTYAWAQRPAMALPLARKRLSEAPDDYEMHYTRTIALNNDHRPAEAVVSLNKLNELRADSKDTADIRKYVTTPLRSYISLNGAYQEDTNDITIQRLGAKGVYVYSPHTRFSLSASQHKLRAPLASGYENISGDQEARYQQGNIGVTHLFNHRLSLDAQAGTASIKDGESHSVYTVGADIWPADGVTLRASYSEQPYAVSPRSLSLEILRRNSQLDLTWSPNLLYTISAMVAGSSLSDDNARTDILLEVSRAMLRTQRWNIDLGISGQRLDYDFDPDNGYYAPDTYERYALNGYAYRKFSEDNALGISASAGGYKDDDMDSFGFSGSLSIEAFIGLYRNWMLDVQAGVFRNSGIETDAYRVNNIEFTLTRRF